MIIKNSISNDTLKGIKILAFDMDGTLLDEKGLLSQANEKALYRAMEKGYHIVIATGRVYSSFPQVVLDMDGIRYRISSNGAHIIDYDTGETIYSNLLSREGVLAAMPWISDRDLMKEVYFDHKVYIDRHCMDNLDFYGVKSDKSKNYVRRTRIPVDDVMVLLHENIDKLENINLVFADPEKRLRYWADLRKIDELTAVSSLPHNIEIGGPTTSKATALKELATMLDLGSEHIMCFGDSSNDEEMMRASKIGVAMGNAVDGLHDVADIITKSNAEDGVAYALTELLNI